MFKAIINFFLDLLFPKKCLGCGKNGTYICNSCLEKIEIDKSNKCPICDRPLPKGQICKLCQKKTSLNYLFWTVPYSNPLTKQLIGLFKYHYVKELVEPLAKLLIKSLESISPISTISTNSTIIVPIPLHKRKLKKRGYNQAELLAKKVAKHFSIPLETSVLQRKRNITPQAKIKDHRTRRANVKNIFEISKEFKKKCLEADQNLIRNKIIILVDDVFTTGATLSEAAKVLKKAGAKEVWGMVIAKG